MAVLCLTLTKKLFVVVTCWPSECCHSLCKVICLPVLLNLDGTASLESAIPYNTYTLPVSSSVGIPEPCGEFGKTSSLELSIPKVLPPCMLSTVLVTVYCKKNVL